MFRSMRVVFLIAAPGALAGSAVQVVQSAEDTGDRLARQPDAPVMSTSIGGLATITIDQGTVFQRVEGFGGAITDSVAHVWSRFDAKLQQQVVDLLWGPTGNQLNLGRLSIGATDFSTVMYSYAEPHDDYEMKNFTLQHDDDSGFIALVQQAQKASPGLGWLSTPWSPPSWLKQNADMRNSKSPGLVQSDEAQKAYALYLSKYFFEMQKRGINVTRMSFQNEPHVKGQFAATYPCCGLTPEQERDFLRDYLGPRLRQDHPQLKIFVHDDQKTNNGDTMMVDYVTAIMKDKEAAQYVDGVAFHWYGDNLKDSTYDALREVHEAHSLPLLATEATLEAPAQQHVGTSPWKEAQKYAYDIIGDLNAWASGWIEWNLLLDQSGGPTCIGPSHTGVCTPDIGHCDAPILADASKQTIEIRNAYYFMGHFSRYIPRGSKIVSARVDEGLALQAVSAITPTSDLVVVVLNQDDAADVQYQIQLQAGQFVSMTIPAHGIQTLTAKAVSSALV